MASNSNNNWRLPIIAKKWVILLILLVLLFKLWQMGIFPTLSVISPSATHFKHRLATNLMGPPDIRLLDQLDPRLWEYIRKRHIFPPSSLRYQLSGYKVPKVYDQLVDVHIDALFKNKRDGFFVEVGAYDGIHSHTLYLEKEWGWKGLLIECHPGLVPKLKAVNRKAYIADLCLSRGLHPDKAHLTSLNKHFASSSMGTGSNLFPNITSNKTTYEVQIVPLFAILAAIEVTQIDFFVLDIQSLEEDVLHNFPFDRVHVKVWVVEVYFLSAEKRTALRRFMEKQGYSKERFWELRPTGYTDYIFVHESFKPEAT